MSVRTLETHCILAIHEASEVYQGRWNPHPADIAEARATTVCAFSDLVSAATVYKCGWIMSSLEPGRALTAFSFLPRVNIFLLRRRGRSQALYQCSPVSQKRQRAFDATSARSRGPQAEKPCRQGRGNERRAEPMTDKSGCAAAALPSLERALAMLRIGAMAGNWEEVARSILSAITE